MKPITGTVLCTKFPPHKKRYEVVESREKPGYAICPACGCYHRVKKEEDSEGETLQDVFDTLTEKQKTVVYAMIGAALEGKEKEEDSEWKILRNVFDTLTEKQKTVVYAIIGMALEEAADEGKEKEK